MQKKITKAHGVLLVTFAIYMMYQWLMQWIPIHSAIFHVIMGQIMLILPGMVWIGISYRKKPVQRAERMLFKPVSNANIKMAVAVIISAYPVVVILNRLSMYFVKNQVAEIMPEMMKIGFFPMLLVMAVMPAFNEEFLCRGILYGAYRQCSKKAGILLSALVFGLFHLNVNQMLYAVYLGIILALMVEATGSVYTSMLMHFLFNGFNVSMNYLVNEILISRGMDPLQSAGTSAQTIADLSVQQLLMMAVFLVIFLFFNGLLIYSTFRMNGRNLKNEAGKGRLIDLLIVFFVIITVILTYINTEFL